MTDPTGRGGRNLPAFQDVQLGFAAHLRNPDVHPAPEDVEPRRMAIYRDLFFNNVDNFLRGNFPVARSLFDEDGWSTLVRDYFHRHAAESPYFLEIPQEFLTYLDTDPMPGLPEFMLELCHYEWVEMALDIAPGSLPDAFVPFDRLASGSDGPELVRSPLAWPLSYRYPVHQIGPANRPDAPPDEPTHLVVYRNRLDEVRFMAVNAVTRCLLDAFQTACRPGQAFNVVSRDMPHLKSTAVHRHGPDTVRQLYDLEILLPTQI